MAVIYYLGHGSFRLISKNGFVVYLDPFAGTDYDIPADLILVTHQHSDHNQIQKPKKNKCCQIFQNHDALKNGEYQTLDISGITVRATEAYNKNHPIDECVGYLISIDGHTLYFAGDTSQTKQMHSLASEKIEYAFLPCDGIYNMGIAEAIKCAEIIRAEHTVPIHMAPGKLYDMEIAKTFTANNAYLLEPGREIRLD